MLTQINILLFLCLSTVFLTAQGENNNFVTKKHVINITSEQVQLSDQTGIANIRPNSAISDKQGNLLFYSDGIQVMDRNFDFLQNGLFLKGNFLNAQSSIFIPNPIDNNLYYLFTKERISNFIQSSGGLQYCVIDRQLNNGLGAVIQGQKNIFLSTNQVEMMTSAKGHCGVVWLISHERNNNHFLAYKIDDKGISAPVISTIGPVFNDLPNFGPIGIPGLMLISPNSEKLVVLNEANFTMDIYDFNRNTGQISNEISIPLDGHNLFRGHYSGAFSGDNTKIYVAIDRDNTPVVEFYQYDISSNDEEIIEQSKQLIGSSRGTNKGLFQLAADEKIYIATNSTRLSSIRFPNKLGAACEFIDTFLVFPNSISNGHLIHNAVKIADAPSQKDSLFLPSDSKICQESPLTIDISEMGDRFLWQDGSIQAQYAITKEGKYWVEVSKGNCIFRDSIEVFEEAIKLNLGKDTLLCPNEPLFLEIPDQYHSYLWQDGSQSSNFKVENGGKYWVEITDENCHQSDTIEVNYHSISLDLGQDITLCAADSLSIEIDIPTAAAILWHDGNKSQKSSYLQPGWNWAQLTQDGCTISDSLWVNRENVWVNLGNDTIICEDAPFLLAINNPSVNIRWQDGSTSNLYQVMESGQYSVEIFTDYCLATDTISISTEACLPDFCNIYIPNIFSPNEDRINDIFEIFSNCEFQQFNLTIRDRWGNLIFETNNPLQTWDGFYQGNTLNNGVYLMKLSYQFKDESFFKKKICHTYFKQIMVLSYLVDKIFRAP